MSVNSLNIASALKTSPGTSPPTPPTSRGRVTRTFVALSGGQTVNAAYQLLSVPMLFGVLGEARYATWILLMTIPSYLALADFGIASVAANEMSIRAGAGDSAGAARVYHALWGGWSVVSVSIFAVALMIVPLLSPSEIPGLALLSPVEFNGSVLMVIAATLLSQATGLANAAFRAGGRNAEGIHITNAGRLLEIVLLIVTVRTEASFLWLIGTMLISRSVTIAGLLAILWWRVPWLRPSPCLRDFNTLRRLFPSGILFLAFPLGHALIGQGMAWVVAVQLGAAALVQLTLARMFTNLVRQGLGLVSNSFWPEISDAYGANDRRRLLSLIQNGFRLSVGLTAAVTAVLLIVGPAVLSAWIKNANVDPTLFRLIVAAMAADGLWTFPLIVPAAVNRHQQVAVWYAIVCAAVVFAVWLTIPIIGITAVPLGLAALGLAMTWVAIGYADRVAHASLWRMLIAPLG